jgi:hypothetical protein
MKLAAPPVLKIEDLRPIFIGVELTLMTEDAPQRDYQLREDFNGLRWVVRTGAP